MFRYAKSSVVRTLRLCISFVYLITPFCFPSRFFFFACLLACSAAPAIFHSLARTTFPTCLDCLIDKLKNVGKKQRLGISTDCDCYRRPTWPQRLYHYNKYVGMNDVDNNAID